MHTEDSVNSTYDDGNRDEKDDEEKGEQKEELSHLTKVCSL